jgi:hypothetical protein
MWGEMLVKIIFHVEKFWQTLILLLICWIGIVILCEGCPFGYLHVWLAQKAGLNWTSNYTFEDSMVYQYILSPIEEVLKSLIALV